MSRWWSIRRMAFRLNNNASSLLAIGWMMTALLETTAFRRRRPSMWCSACVFVERGMRCVDIQQWVVFCCTLLSLQTSVYCCSLVSFFSATLVCYQWNFHYGSKLTCEMLYQELIRIHCGRRNSSWEAWSAEKKIQWEHLWYLPQIHNLCVHMQVFIWNK